MARVGDRETLGEGCGESTLAAEQLRIPRPRYRAQRQFALLSLTHDLAEQA